MAAISEEQRIPALRRLGVSETLIRLSSGELLGELFRETCLGPPYYVYHGARTPDGAELIPLWDYSDTVVGVWEKTDGIEFIDFDIEDRGGYRPLARTEQGFWATQFDFLYECETPLQELEQGAATIGFRFLEQYLSARGGRECGHV